MGTSKIIKRDNRFRYISKAFQQFCSQWNIEHETGTSYNPQGQGILKYAYGSLKSQFQKIKVGEIYPQSPHNVLSHTPFNLNFLNMDACEHSAMGRFWHDNTKVIFTKARWKDLSTDYGKDMTLS